MIKELQDLETHLSLMSDLTGFLAKMLNTMSSGRWLFLIFPRVGGCAFVGSLV